ncbi:MAG: class GN sortase [Rhodospirillales bacterium]|nr:class GN sortase [Rhodospirillales bacterium]MBO6788093.1 class GN sortase [Rhodospirillales bacterium]
MTRLSARRKREITGIVLIAIGLVLAGYGLYIPAKAALAQELLERAWAAAPAHGAAPRPWPWADTRPVARISAPRLEVSLIVLSGAHGRSLPFGPGHVDGTALPGEPGHSVVAAHRDTHFAFLKDTRIGDRIDVARPGGRETGYVVVEKSVLDTRKEKIRLDPGADILTLVTCYPFTDWNPGGPLRYVVTAVAATSM